MIRTSCNKILLLFALVLGSCGAGPGPVVDPCVSAKTTVRNVFLYAGRKQYDSLKSIMPGILFKNAQADDLKINFRDFKKMIDAGEASDTAAYKIV